MECLLAGHLKISTKRLFVNYGENPTILSIDQSYNGSLAFRDKNTCRSDLRSRFRWTYQAKASATLRPVLMWSPAILVIFTNGPGRRFGVYVGEETSGLMNFATRNPCNLSRTSAAQLNY